MGIMSLFSGLLEYKKQTLIIAALTLIVAALASLYAMMNNGENAADQGVTQINITVEQPKPEEPSRSDEVRKGKFIPSKPITF